MCVQSSKFPIPTKNHEKLMLLLLTFLILLETLASEILLPYIFFAIAKKNPNLSYRFSTLDRESLLPNIVLEHFHG